MNQKNIINNKGEIHSVSYKDDSGYGVYYETFCGIAAFNFGSEITWFETGKDINCIDCMEAVKSCG